MHNKTAGDFSYRENNNENYQRNLSAQQYKNQTNSIRFW